MLKLDLAPLLPTPALAVLALIALVAIAAGLMARQPGAILRALAFAALLAAMLDPRIILEERDRLPDTVAVVVDRSGSQTLDVRPGQTDAVKAEVERRLSGLPGVETRIIEARETEAANGTRLFDALEAGLADVPRERLAGVIVITDGVVHDIPASAAALGLKAPVHALITGRPAERDRRIEVVEAPRFGIVGKDVLVRLRVYDTGGTEPVPVTLRRDGIEIAARMVAPGQTVSVAVRVEHSGPNVLEIDVAPATPELTVFNNKAVATIDGVREKLRVLLVSGEPHAGERTWRNLLKSDASVDLVHFTILRPPEKQDGTPINELSLIAFPTRELFVQKIKEFDLIIFDRYANTSILPSTYFENIARYVREGGAVLLAAGPEYAGLSGLWNTPLGQVLPARPDGRMVERAFKARITDAGKRHPAARGLPGSETEPPAWGDWLRVIGASTRTGTPILSAGSDDLPLLILNRVEKGRVGLFLSDHAWLWARGYQGGGPHLDMLRRLGHWLMKEPDLEEEALRATSKARDILIERQTMGDLAGPALLISPTGAERPVDLTPAEPGLWRGRIAATETGLHRLRHGGLEAFVSIGNPNPREFQDVVSDIERLRPLAESLGGSVRRIAPRAGEVVVPRIVAIRSGAVLAGSDYIGIRPTDTTIVRGVSVWPVFLGLAGLLILIAALAGTWIAEGRSSRRPASAG